MKKHFITKALFLIIILFIFSGTAFAKPNLPSNAEVLREVIKLEKEFADYKVELANNTMQSAEKTIDWFIGLSTVIVAIFALFVTATGIAIALAGKIGWNKLKGKQDTALDEIKVEHLSEKANRELGALKSKNEQSKTNEVIKLLNEAIQINPNHHNSLYDRACAYSLQKNKKMAIEDLTKAFAMSDKNKDWAKRDPDFKNIRNTKEFKELIDEEIEKPILKKDEPKK